jgi:hypothetical protein
MPGVGGRGGSCGVGTWSTGPLPLKLDAISNALYFIQIEIPRTLEDVWGLVRQGWSAGSLNNEASSP